MSSGGEGIDDFLPGSKGHCVTIGQPLEVGESAVGAGKVRRMITCCGYRKRGRAAAPTMAFRMSVGKGKGTRTIMIGGRAITPHTDTANRREVIEPAVIDAISVFLDGDESLRCLVNLGGFDPLAVGGMIIVLSLIP